MEPRHSFQKEAGQDLTDPSGSLYQREETQYHHRIDSSTLLCCSQMQSQKLLQRYIYFFFFISGSQQCYMMKRCKLRSQEQQMAFEFFCFFIRPGVFLGITKYCSAWVMLESGSDWDQKSDFRNAPHPALSSLTGPPSTDTAICGWGLPV